ncbi:MAG: hypothetical protein NTX66_00115 [Candidatus Falkowbacteria bacterium]|nr:hypothetical protein [Candidatus Falkowbacteria bacterium]
MKKIILLVLSLIFSYSLFNSLNVLAVDSSTDDNIPRVMFWRGKVNQHWDLENKRWETDPDGSSGANVDKLTYCQRFYSNIVRVEEYKNETISTWHSSGNSGNYSSTRLSYRCLSDGKTSLSLAPKPEKIIIAPIVGQPVVANSSSRLVKLIVSIKGNGSANISSSDGKIDCGLDKIKCSANYYAGEQVDLSVAPASDSTSMGLYSDYLDNEKEIIKKIGKNNFSILINGSNNNLNTQTVYPIIYLSDFDVEKALNSHYSSDENLPRVMFSDNLINQYWDAKANIWKTDPDNISNSDDKLSYCRKFYPSARKVEPYRKEFVDNWKIKDLPNTKVPDSQMSYRCVLDKDSKGFELITKFIGDGEGSIFGWGPNAKMNCGYGINICSNYYNVGDVVNLGAAASSTSLFKGWYYRSDTSTPAQFIDSQLKMPTTNFQSGATYTIYVRFEPDPNLAERRLPLVMFADGLVSKYNFNNEWINQQYLFKQNGVLRPASPISDEDKLAYCRMRYLSTKRIEFYKTISNDSWIKKEGDTTKYTATGTVYRCISYGEDDFGKNLPSSCHIKAIVLDKGYLGFDSLEFGEHIDNHYNYALSVKISSSSDVSVGASPACSEIIGTNRDIIITGMITDTLPIERGQEIKVDINYQKLYLMDLKEGNYYHGFNLEIINNKNEAIPLNDVISKVSATERNNKLWWVLVFAAIIFLFFWFFHKYQSRTNKYDDTQIINNNAKAIKRGLIWIFVPIFLLIFIGLLVYLWSAFSSPSFGNDSIEILYFAMLFVLVFIELGLIMGLRCFRRACQTDYNTKKGFAYVFVPIIISFGFFILLVVNDVFINTDFSKYIPYFSFLFLCLAVLFGFVRGWIFFARAKRDSITKLRGLRWIFIPLVCSVVLCLLWMNFQFMGRNFLYDQLEYSIANIVDKIFSYSAYLALVIIIFGSIRGIILLRKTEEAKEQQNINQPDINYLEKKSLLRTKRRLNKGLVTALVVTFLLFLIDLYFYRSDIYRIISCIIPLFIYIDIFLIFRSILNRKKNAKLIFFVIIIPFISIVISYIYTMILVPFIGDIKFKQLEEYCKAQSSQSCDASMCQVAGEAAGGGTGYSIDTGDPIINKCEPLPFHRVIWYW